jgi:hypothetical protein
MPVCVLSEIKPVPAVDAAMYGVCLMTRGRAAILWIQLIRKDGKIGVTYPAAKFKSLAGLKGVLCLSSRM